MALLDDNKANILFKHYLGAGSTRLSREFFEEAVKSSFIVKPEQLWMYSDELPNGEVRTEEWKKEHHNYLTEADIVNLNKDNPFLRWEIRESTYVTLVQYQHQVPCEIIDKGTLNSFQIISNKYKDNIYQPNANPTKVPAKNIIPFNFSKIDSEWAGLYNYTLYTEDGEQIPFGVGDWVVDTYSGILTFYGELPTGVSVEHPPKLSYFEYIGGNGFRQDEKNFEGIILPIEELKFDNTCVINSSISSKIIDKANLIEKDFVKNYKWDGNDKNEGIALSFEKEIPLIYPNSNDIVKGYDEAKDCEVRTVLSSKFSENPQVLFVSQSVSEGPHLVSLSKLSSIISKLPEERQLKPIRVDLEDGYIIYKPNSITPSDLEFEVVDTRMTDGKPTKWEAEQVTIACALVFFDPTLRKYWPYLNEKENTTIFNTGFPLVTLHGKVPPSVVMDMSLLSHDEDSITPDYYGPRITKVIIASEDTKNNKSADFISHKTQYFFLNDILRKIKDDEKYNSKNAKVILREGSYFVDGPILLNDFILEGEGKVTISNVASDEAVVIFGNNPEFGIFNNLTIDKLALSGDGDITLNNLTSITLDANSTGKIEIFNGNIETLNKIDESKDIFVLDNSKVNTVKIDKITNGIITSNTIDSLDLNEKDKIAPGKVLIDSNAIGTLTHMSEAIYLYSNYIAKFPEDVENLPNYLSESKDRENNRTTGRLPIYGKDDANRMRYAEIDSPLKFFETKGEQLELKDDNKECEALRKLDDEINYPSPAPIVRLLRDHTLQQRDDGRLYAWLNPSEIYIKPNTEFQLSNTAHEGEEGEKPDVRLENPKFSKDCILSNETVDKNKLSTLDDVLRKLFKDKADLNAGGKIPLQQIPDAIASSGLTYVGTWNFADYDKDGNKKFAKNIYPSFKTLTERGFLEPEVGRLQKGWFLIVKPGPDPEAAEKKDYKIKYDPKGESWIDNPTYPQYSCKYDDDKSYENVFTAGDWLVWQGTTGYRNENKVDPKSSEYSETEDEKNIAESGQGWVKLDRAYLDPVYTNLPQKVRNNDWYWKDEEGTEGGALNFSEQRADYKNTLLDALYDINKELLSLYHDKAQKVSDLEFDFDLSDLPSYTIIDKVTNKEETYHYIDKEDLTHKNTITATLKAKEDAYNKDKFVHNSFYFGDKATYEVKINDDIYTSEEYNDFSNDVSEYKGDNSKYTIFKKEDSHKDQDGGKGKYFSTNIEYLWKAREGINNVSFALTSVGLKSFNEGKELNTIRDSAYATLTEGAVELKAKPNPSSLNVTGEITHFSLNGPHYVDGDAVYHTEENSYLENGIIPINNIKISGFIPNQFPKNFSCKVSLFIGSTQFTEEKRIDESNTHITMENDTITLDEINLKLLNEVHLPLDRGEITLLVNDIEFYNQKVSRKWQINTIHISNVTSEETRVRAGKGLTPAFNPEATILDPDFGKEWEKEKFLCAKDYEQANSEYPLQRVSRFDKTENREVSEYRIPEGYVNLTGNPEDSKPVTIKGEVIKENIEYYSACFRLAKDVVDASGFTFEIEVAGDYKKNYEYDALNASTKDLLIRCCFVDNGVCGPWLDCNLPYDGLSKVGENGYENVMYAAHSNEFIKRITFGRSTFSGDIYVRILVPKIIGKTFSFKSIKLIEVI